MTRHLIERKPCGAAARAAGTIAAIFCVSACGVSSGPSKRVAVHIGPGQIGTIIGTGERATDPVDGNADGKVDAPIPALDAHLDSPLDVAFSPEGRLFVLDWNGHKIRAMDPDGTLAFIAGTGKEGDACEAVPSPTDGTCPAADAEMNHPTDVTFDPEGRLVIAAWHNAKIKVEDLNTGLVVNECGTGSRKFEGDGMTCRDAATKKDQVSFDLPSSVAFDKAGNLFISDQANQVVRRIAAADGTVKSVAGNCPGSPGFGCSAGQGYDGDGAAATSAHLSNSLGQGTDPQGKIAFDRDGNLYIADTGNNAIRKVTPGVDGIIGDGDPTEEIITTIAGTGKAGHGGDGGPADRAELSSPTDVAVADDGTLYIADRSNSCVRQVTPDGTISTVAGQCGSPGFAGDGELATEAALQTPYGVALDGKGALYVSDTLNHCVRKVLLVK